MTVEFSNVGRDKKTWTAEVADLSDRTLIRQIHNNSALMSSGIDFAWNDAGDEAGIYVGGFRRVGALRVTGAVKLVIGYTPLDAYYEVLCTAKL